MNNVTSNIKRLLLYKRKLKKTPVQQTRKDMSISTTALSSAGQCVLFTLCLLGENCICSKNFAL